jgi:hypothetical protein
MGVSEKLELLGHYSDIPSTITIKSIPTASELDYVGAEDFEETMLDKIFPQAIEEKFNYHQLLEIDFQWICRALRILNYGPYYTTNAIYCTDCGTTSRGEYRVNLMTVECIPLPEKFDNLIKIDRSEFMDFNKDVTIHLLTISESLAARKDKLFQDTSGRSNMELARMCYMISAVGGDSISPVEVKRIVTTSLSPADYILLKNRINELINYGLRMGGTTTCPKCKSKDAAFIAATDARFFRATVGDILQWRDDRRSGKDKDISGDKTGAVQQNN